MRAIINRKIYDTRKAKRIGAWTAGRMRVPIYEFLYSTKDGDFFLHKPHGYPSIEAVTVEAAYKWVIHGKLLTESKWKIYKNRNYHK